ncbi:MAG: DUF1987 domain-containing protein, partial [Bacteroidales bacterium]|nr:DUF1987 domain-containing protein [Bacteroidales bacterium]
MEVIKIKGTDDTPAIILDKDNGVFEISGRSLPEDVTTFFEPVLNWLDDYQEEANDQTVFAFKLVYFNTASSKLILDILMKLEEMHENGKEVLIKWFFPDDDEDMEEAGEEYADIVDVPFEQVSYTM